jgi:hypothetical protein
MAEIQVLVEHIAKLAIAGYSPYIEIGYNLGLI